MISVNNSKKRRSSRRILNCGGSKVDQPKVSRVADKPRYWSGINIVLIMLKQFIFAFLAAILLMAQISLLSCTPSTCIVGAPARELMPTPLLAISDFLLNYQMINIKLLHLIGQLTVVAELLHHLGSDQRDSVQFCVYDGTVLTLIARLLNTPIRNR
jgi:hypothetical protein